MEKDILKFINNMYQNIKLELNKAIFDLDYGEKNVEKYETEMWNLEYEYSLLRRKRTFLQIKHHILSMLTLGIYIIISKKSYELSLDDLEYKIVRVMFDMRDLQENIKKNENILSTARESYAIKEKLYNNLKMSLEFFDALREDEISKFLNYKIGDNYAANKNN